MSCKQRHSFLHGCSRLAWLGLSWCLPVPGSSAPSATHPADNLTAASADRQSSTAQGRTPRPNDGFIPPAGASEGNFHTRKRICHVALARVPERPDAGPLGRDLPHARNAQPQNVCLGQLEDSARTLAASHRRQGPRRPTITARGFWTRSSSGQRGACHPTLAVTTSYRKGGEYR